MTIKTDCLPNGLTVATDTCQDVSSVILGVWVGVGSCHENVAQNGLSHFLEHMAFKGTTTRSAKDIADAIESVGGHMNAYTSREQTAYHIKVLKEDVPLAIDILTDILHNSIFDETELERERQVILQEIGQTNDTPDDIVFDYFQEQAFADQALGRSILGPVSNIENFTAEDLRTYMTHYHPKTMRFIAVGDINHQDFVDQVTQKGWGAYGTHTTQPVIMPSHYTGGKRLYHKDLEQVHILTGYAGVPYNDPLHMPYLIYSSILGGGMSSRLFQEIREKRGLVYSVYSYHSAYRDGGLLSFYGGTSPDKAAEYVDVLRHELAALSQSLRLDELEKAKRQYKAALLMGRESMGNRAEQMATHLLFLDQVKSVPEIIDSIESVSLDDIHNVAHCVLASNQTLVALGQTEGLADK
jgi:predicted Zn-dependent peptidase